ncbi:DUF2309 domain-containing protein [Methylomicrobium sp. Wu6]|uniref:DUF2309 domain-containing protein n=1 Tax=Methylomicrobium sp. Wu6 TaxID=3107928 RepID=UPI002DD63B31|nr:DUF2309 domain-containing protein [Methylomicrobium sp. Wu6]MEC4750477.1 DUF2309 domain-containing protein [Methylomicrobium sp. Wu6]
MQDIPLASAIHEEAGDAALRAEIGRILHELDHVLPGQAPILDFVHHNTLHGYQHLPFEEALAEAERITGICGYLPESKFRGYYRQGRISDDDLFAALPQDADSNAEELVCTVNGKKILRRDVYRIAMLFDLEPITESQLNWNIEELGALDAIQQDVPKQVRACFLGEDATSIGEKNRVRQLWNRILAKLNLDETVPHPENLLDLSREQAEAWLALAMRDQPDGAAQTLHEMMRREAGATLSRFIAEVGERLTLGGFIRAITGIDILEVIRPQLIRICASAMDEGMAPWQLPERDSLGLYAGWRKMFRCDVNPVFLELPEWSGLVDKLPEDAVDAIIEQLTYLNLPRAKWTGYLQRLALELPGWSGMINWRQQHPGYLIGNHTDVSLADYLAIRLVYDRLWLGQICRDVWKIEARLNAIESYFRKNLSELMVRSELYKGELPEYLAQKAKALILRARSERHFKPEWQELSDQIRTWQLSPLARRKDRHYHWSSGWQLFRLCQHLGMTGAAVEALPQGEVEALLKLLNAFTFAERGKVWLTAYERNYREKLFQALSANRGRGRWASRRQGPEAQLIFCMDEREESFRRHLEEVNPAVETLGAAGFFGIPMYYKGLDDTKTSPLCPVVVTPAHEVREVARSGCEEDLRRHSEGRKLNLGLGNLLHHGLRRNFMSAHLMIDAFAPAVLLGLLAKSLLPKPQNRLLGRLAGAVAPEVPTRLVFVATDQQPAVPALAKPGFTDTEQADRVAGFLKSTGLTHGFSPLVVLVGHGSSSQNNPHRAAYDCGACSGRHGGPNARVFAAMANRQEIRKLLGERGIDVPADTWFIGAEHNTCNEEIIWFDQNDLPTALQPALQRLRDTLSEVRRRSAHERCRRLASAPRNPTPEEALAHIEERADDFSQARPELGHATNACALVGRRSITQGAFFDRRMFLISYDPTQDPEGLIVENILLAVGPVGAGINLEYYFSTIDNDRFGCGTKVPHNVIGLFGVMEGASSDLRTGLPSQMIEIHEPMRLQVIVDAKTAVLEQIYQRQAPLRELIANGWIHLSSIDPETGEIFMFERGRGFVRWQGGDMPILTVENSQAAYRDQTGPVAPVLIRQPVAAGG